MEPLSDLQLAEELIKQEMITMLHHDCLHHPLANTAGQLQRSKGRGPASTSNNASHITHLETHQYKPLGPEDMEQVNTYPTVPQFTSSLHSTTDSLTVSLFSAVFLTIPHDFWPLSLTHVTLTL